MSTTVEAKGVSLGQTEIWVDRRGVEHRVDEVSVRYKTNVIGFLERGAPRIVSKAVGRKVADAIVSATAVMFKPVPCVQCEGLDGDGTKKIHRWEHGVDHLMVDPDKYPDETDGMVQNLWDQALAAAPSYTAEEAVEMVRGTPFMQRLIEDVAAGRGGDDG